MDYFEVVVDIQVEDYMEADWADIVGKVGNIHMAVKIVVDMVVEFVDIVMEVEIMNKVGLGLVDNLIVLDFGNLN